MSSTIAAELLRELESEAKATRECLQQVPMEDPDYKPHERSMPLGYLAIRLAGGLDQKLAFVKLVSVLFYERPPRLGVEPHVVDERSIHIKYERPFRVIHLFFW